MVDAFLKGPLVVPSEFEEDIVALAQSTELVSEPVILTVNESQISSPNLSNWH